MENLTKDNSHIFYIILWSVKMKSDEIIESLNSVMHDKNNQTRVLMYIFQIYHAGLICDTNIDPLG